jgi:hypothetical protein
MFASKTISGHLARGLVGLGAVVVAMFLSPSQPWLAIALLPFALIALRGCPMCWTVGLVQTLHAKLSGKRGRRGRCVATARSQPAERHPRHP